MFRKSFHEYLFSKQDPEDIYYKYREHRKKMLETVHKAATTKEIEVACLPVVAKALQKEINNILNKWNKE